MPGVGAHIQDAEVARLTRELNEAREQQTATSEILGVISRSNFSLQPILQSVVSTAMRLCRAEQAVIYRQEEGTYRFDAGHSTVPDYLDIEKRTVIAPDKGTVVGRAALTRQVARIDDAWNDPLYEKKRDAKIGGVRSMIGVPLLREGEPIGVIALARNRVEPFTDREIDLVTMFADQAVIASVRSRHWLIPAYHAALDAEIPNGHDDPLNFDPESFAESLEAVVKKLQPPDEMRAANRQ
jgi:two-component system NtrC family sensor kinase